MKAPMKKLIIFLLVLSSFLSISSCVINNNIPQSTDDGMIEFRIIQLNDVYEIAPIQNGKYGGMARVAQFINEHKAAESNTMTVLSGDFLNPSLLGTIKNNGKRIKGAHMVDLMNLAGIDLVSFGNHEFDLDEDELQERINESAFDWVSTDVFQKCGDRIYPFYKEKAGKKLFIPEDYTWTFSDEDGTEISVGYFSACVASNPVDYVYYADYTQSSIEKSKELSARCDLVLAITHLNLVQDLELAKELHDVPLIIGGHDHDNMIHQVGSTRITKADANAKTVYVHYFTHNTKTGNTRIKSELVEINESIEEEGIAKRRVDDWMQIQNDNLKLVVDNPNEVIYSGDDMLDGLESSIRHKQTNMGALFSSAMLWASADNAQAAILNSGSIRIDDQIGAPIVALDIFRALPFGGKLVDVELTGKLLI